MKTNRPYTLYVPARMTNDEAKWVVDEYMPLFHDPKNHPGDPTWTQSDWRQRYALLVDAAVKVGESHHIFLRSREFCDWLVTCVKEEINSAHWLFLVSKMGARPIVYHFPTGSGWDSFWIRSIGGLDMNGESDACDRALCYKFSRNASSTHRSQCGTVPFDRVLKWDPQMSDGVRAVKMAVGLAMYMACFPETVLPGVPADLQHPAHHDYANVTTVGISPKITLGGTHDAPHPHFRKAHLRFLQSERFTNKRYQVVLVNETFVNAKVSTVLSPEETDATLQPA